MQDLKCKNCGANLTTAKGVFFCEYCHSTFIPKSVALPFNNNCTVRNGLLVKYNGAEKNIVIPNTVYSIGPNAFANNLAIESVIFPDTLNTISDNAFDGCANLKKILNYNTINTFGNECFKGTGLTEVTIGNEVLSIGTGAFSNMPNLTTVYYYPNKNLRLKYTFSKCPKLINVKMNQKYFFPYLAQFELIKNNPNNKRPTYQDAFWNTPYFTNKRDELMANYKAGVCPDCGGTIKKGLMHSICQSCGIDYRS